MYEKSSRFETIDIRMQLKYGKIAILSLVAGVLLSVDGYGIGAPDAACQEMLPGHQEKPQVGEPPARMNVSTRMVKPGGTVELVLQAVEAKFMGFIIQVRDAANPDIQVGSFVAEDNAKYMTCGRGIHNSLTHRTSEPKQNVTVTWRAPSDFQGEVLFVYTVLKDYNTYWVKQKAARVRVSDKTEKEVLDELVQEDEALLITEIEQQVTEQAAIDALEQLVTESTLKEEVVNDTLLHEIVGEEHQHPKPDLKDLLNKDLHEHDLLSQDLDLPQPSQREEQPLNLAKAEDKVEPVDTFTPIYLSSTTTLSTSTTTETPYFEPPREINGVLQHTDPKDDIFIGCNATKACFGIPDNCVKSGKCTAVIAYSPDRLKFRFQMKALSPGYISFGLSRDGKMGEDFTTNCMIQENGNVDIAVGYNYGKRWNRPPNVSRREDGISERIESGRRDGWIYCTWTRNRTVVAESEIWDLEKDKYFIMLAVGEVYDSQIQMHQTKAVSGTARGLGEVGLINSKSRLYIVLHGSFMIGAWIFCASLGIMFSRYYKQTWTSCRIFNLDQWFIWHRSLMILVWCLSIVGLVLIIVDVGGLTSTILHNPHGIMGFISCGLAFLQPLLALLRCNPMHNQRWIFNWIHWFIGNAAQILAVLCIFFAVDLEKALLPRPETDYLLIAWVAFHFLTHILMSLMNCASDSRAAKTSPLKYPGRGYSGHRSNLPYPDYEELKRDAPGSGIRTFTLVMYGIINAVVTAALILLVAMAPTRPVLIDIGILQTQ